MHRSIVFIIAITFFTVNFLQKEDTNYQSNAQAVQGEGQTVVGLNPQLHSGTFDTAGQAFTKELGAHSLRLAYNHGDYNFGVDWAFQNGVSVLFMLGYGDGCDPTIAAGRQCYADRSANLAQTYGSKVKYYEVWNEWNRGFGLNCRWGQAGTPCVDEAMYTDLLCRTHNAIKAVQPNAIIVGGATAGVDMNFIDDMFDAGAGSCMDMISVHPYVYTETLYSVPYNSSGSVGADKFVEAVTALNNLVIQKTGSSKPIVISEDGRTDQGNTANEQITADYLAEIYKRAPSIPFLEGIWWYELEDAINDIQGYGLLRSNNTKKLSFAAYQAAAKSASTTSTVSADKVTTAPNVDGNLSEGSWNLQTNVTKNVIGTGNNTTTFDLLWDNTYLYVGAKVLDATLNNDSTDLWDDDAVEVYILKVYRLNDVFKQQVSYF